MKHLSQFVEMQNRMSRVFNQPQIDVRAIDEKVAEDLFQKLDSNLSPEHLTCDGERPLSEQRRFYKLYTGAIKDLQKMGFSPKQAVYNF